MAKRKSGFTQALADEICERMALGESLRQICRDAHMPHESTVRSWVVGDAEGFGTQYAKAMALKVDYWADEIIDIADRITGSEDSNELVARARLKIDTRKWIMAKLRPERFGDRVTSVLEGGSKPVEVKEASDMDISRAVNFLLAQHQTGALEAWEPDEDDAEH